MNIVEFGTHCIDLMEEYDAIVTHDGHENAEKYLTENFVSSIKGTMKVLKEMSKENE